MNKKTSSLLFIVIPFIIEMSVVVLFIIAGNLEHPTNRGMFALSAVMGSILAPIPCGISSVIGIRNAVKLKKLGENTICLIVIGIINIVVSFVVAIFWLRVYVPIFFEVV